MRKVLIGGNMTESLPWFG